MTERIREYVRTAKSVGFVRATQDLGIPLAKLLDVGATIYDLLFNRERTTLSWRPYFFDDVFQNDVTSSLDGDTEGLNSGYELFLT